MNAKVWRELGRFLERLNKNQNLTMLTFYWWLWLIFFHMAGFDASFEST